MADAALRVLIMAGGTGGHVFPALAVAKDLQQQYGATITWLGTKNGIEATVVPDNNLSLHTIQIAGLRGKSPLNIIKGVAKLLLSVMQTLRYFFQLKPQVVLGMGGFAAGPGGLVAWLLRKPLVIHEQNSVAGTTNRLLARFANKVLTGFPNVLSHYSGQFVGNPLRANFINLPTPQQRNVAKRGTLRLLILGGSLGAKPINNLLPPTLKLLDTDLLVRHQAGKSHAETLQAEYQQAGIGADVQPFINDMAAAYQWADLVICRAGALTVAEIAAVGVAAIFIPLPHAIDDHQTGNARWLEEQGAAVLLRQSTLTAESLAAQIEKLVHQPERLIAMAVAARAMAKPEATHLVANYCHEVACA